MSTQQQQVDILVAVARDNTTGQYLHIVNVDSDQAVQLLAQFLEEARLQRVLQRIEHGEGGRRVVPATIIPTGR